MKSSSGIANKISMALSRVVWSKNNNVVNEDDEVSDFLILIDELNQNTNLTKKLVNQSKICKMLEANDDIFFFS